MLILNVVSVTCVIHFLFLPLFRYKCILWAHLKDARCIKGSFLEFHVFSSKVLLLISLTVSGAGTAGSRGNFGSRLVIGSLSIRKAPEPEALEWKVHIITVRSLKLCSSLISCSCRTQTTSGPKIWNRGRGP